MTRRTRWLSVITAAVLAAGTTTAIVVHRPRREDRVPDWKPDLPTWDDVGWHRPNGGR